MEEDNNEQQGTIDINFIINNNVKELRQIPVMDREKSLFKRYLESLSSSNVKNQEEIRRREFMEFRERCAKEEQILSQLHMERPIYGNPLMQSTWKSRRYPRSTLCERVRLFSTLRFRNETYYFAEQGKVLKCFFLNTIHVFAILLFGKCEEYD